MVNDRGNPGAVVGGHGAAPYANQLTIVKKAVSADAAIADSRINFRFQSPHKILSVFKPNHTRTNGSVVSRSGLELPSNLRYLPYAWHSPRLHHNSDRSLPDRNKTPTQLFLRHGQSATVAVAPKHRGSAAKRGVKVAG